MIPASASLASGKLTIRHSQRPERNLRNLLLGYVAAAAIFASPLIHAQSTDGYHAVQVLPLVVDTASFSSTVWLHNPRGGSLQITPTYIPATGTSQASPVACPPVTLDGGRVASFKLRDLCPLPSGSQFGFLHLAADPGGVGPELVAYVFSAFARVQNPQGIGFSIEGFPAHTFTSATTVVTGLKRTLATAAAPAYQSNCFLGNLNDMTQAPSPVQTTIAYVLVDAQRAQIGAGQVTLVPGQIVRLLDIFAAAGAAPGDYENVTARFSEVGDGEPGLLTFCTVQDNTSFGADFRIGKQEAGDSFASTIASPAAQDDLVLRDSRIEQDVALSDGAGGALRRPFSIPASGAGNTHLMQFRHPDWITCELLNPATGTTANNEYGLEMRLIASDGKTVLAGGSGVTVFYRLYLGDKSDRDGGVNTRYTLEVEGSEPGAGVARPYWLHCVSGSGHNAGELLRTGGPNQF